MTSIGFACEDQLLGEWPLSFYEPLPEWMMGAFDADPDVRRVVLGAAAAGWSRELLFAEVARLLYERAGEVRCS
jgi:hypothetical protein